MAKRKDKFTPDPPKSVFKEALTVGPGTNRSGYRTTRNLDKKFRSVRQTVDEGGDVHNNELDYMKRGQKGTWQGIPVMVGDKRTNSTGCYGDLSTWGIRATVVDARGLPGKPRRTKRKKHAGRLYHGIAWIDSNNKSFIKLRKIRDQLVTIQVIGLLINRRLLSERVIKFIDHIEYYLRLIGNHEQLKRMEEADTQRDKCLKGQCKTGSFFSPKINRKQLSGNLDKALRVMGKYAQDLPFEIVGNKRRRGKRTNRVPVA